MEDTMTDIFSYQDEIIEEIKDEEVFEPQVNNQVSEINNDLIEVSELRKVDKVLLVQIILLVAWALLTTLIYFYGYDFFEPYIKI